MSQRNLARLTPFHNGEGDWRLNAVEDARPIPAHISRLRKNALFGRQFGELLYLTRALVAVNRL